MLRTYAMTSQLLDTSEQKGDCKLPSEIRARIHTPLDGLQILLTTLSTLPSQLE